MEKSTKIVLTSCSIGCLLVILIFVAVGLGGFVFVKDMVGAFEETEQTRRTVEERFGRPEDFVPEPDGTIPPERMEAFLAVRDFMAPTREEMESTFTTLGNEEEGAGSTFEKVRAGIALMPQMAKFYSARNEALLEGGMGPGEYSYIYAMSYYAVLGKEPGDGPPFRLRNDDRNGGAEFNMGELDSEDRREHTAETLNRKLLPLLRNQLAALEDTEGMDAWRESLASEVAAMEKDRLHLPWSDGAPTPLAASISPYRARLEESYRPNCNLLEIAIDIN